MKKIIFTLLIGFSIFCLIAATQFTSQKPKKLNQQTNQSVLSIADIKSLETRGFTFAGQYLSVCSPRMLDSTNLPETTHIKMGLDLRKAKNLQITWSGAPTTKKVATSTNDIIWVRLL